jgi:tRNA1(Val) A37 N6-methylase TrmN6
VPDGFPEAALAATFGTATEGDGSRDGRRPFVHPAEGWAIPEKGRGDPLEIPFYDDETIEDLRTGGLRLVQKRDGFRFGEDSVFLAAFAAGLYPRSADRPLRAADLGCGCGSVAVLLSRRLPRAVITGIELIPRIADVATRNASLNRLSDRLRFVRGDLRDLRGRLPNRTDDLFPHHAFDLVVSNPPYRIPTTAAAPATSAAPTTAAAPAAAPSELVVAREEVACTLDDLLGAAVHLLRSRGRLVLVHGPERLPDLMESLRRHHLEPETLRMVLPAADRAPSCLLVSATANGRPGGFRILPPLIVRDADGAYTREADAIYGRETPLPDDALMAGLVPSGADPLAGISHIARTPRPSPEGG